MLRSLPRLLAATLPAMALAQCTDTCDTANNGVCDAACAIGTDCTDCAAADRIRDILLIVFGVGTGLGAIGLCYCAYHRCRTSTPPDVEKAQPTKPDEKKGIVQVAKRSDMKADTAVKADKDAKKDKGEKGDTNRKPQMRTILGVNVEAVATERKATGSDPAKKLTVGTTQKNNTTTTPLSNSKK